MATVKRDGAAAGTVALAPGTAQSSFEGTLELTHPGSYDVTLYAFDPVTGNAGVDRVAFTAR
ncbi:MAG TPA: hypothetical protein VI078_16235 [bacterium]